MPSAGLAQSSTQAFGECLVEQSTGKDRKNLAIWLFFALSQHKDVKKVIDVPDQDVQSATDRFADTSIRLMTKDCRKEFKAAYKDNGVSAVEVGFAALGKVAAQEMFTDPNVQKSMSGFDSSENIAALEEVLKEK